MSPKEESSNPSLLVDIVELSETGLGLGTGPQKPLKGRVVKVFLKALKRSEGEVDGHFCP
jgi:hypothetical protein